MLSAYDDFMNMNLEDKLYTSTEVAQVLGVSLRSVYRYMEEGKLDAEVKTATGRHRFTKKNILDFLYPTNSDQQPSVPAPQKQVKTVEPQRPVREQKQEILEPRIAEAPRPVAAPVQEVPVEEEPQVDWLAKFREAAAKFKAAEESQKAPEERPAVPVYQSEQVTGLSSSQTMLEDEPEEETTNYYYYRSMVGGLKDIAQNIDKSSRRSFVDYAFSMNAGLSLHKPIKPFSILHVYVKEQDRPFFEKVLNLVPSESRDAQLCLLTTRDLNVFSERKEMHGLYVVSDKQLRKDLINSGELSLAAELDH